MRSFAEDPNLDVELTVTDSAGSVLGVGQSVDRRQCVPEFRQCRRYLLPESGWRRFARTLFGLRQPGVLHGGCDGVCRRILSGDFDQDGSLTVDDLDLLMADIYLYSVKAEEIRRPSI